MLGKLFIFTIFITENDIMKSLSGEDGAIQHAS